jgi:hypothetical protein
VSAARATAREGWCCCTTAPLEGKTAGCRNTVEPCDRDNRRPQVGWNRRSVADVIGNMRGLRGIGRTSRSLRCVPTTPAILRNCSSSLSRRPISLSAAASSLVAERANSSPQPFNKLASLAAKCGVIDPAPLLSEVARRLRVALQEGQHGIKRQLILQQRFGARSSKRSPSAARIGFASCGEAHSPQPIWPQRRRANSNKMFHCQGAPESGMWRNTLWYWQPRHGDEITAVEIIVQKWPRARVVFAREHQSSTVELHVVEQPSPHCGQIGNGLDVMIAPTSEDPHPPAAALLAEEKDPVGFDQGSESFLLATMFLTNCLRCRRVTQVSF